MYKITWQIENGDTEYYTASSLYWINEKKTELIRDYVGIKNICLFKIDHKGNIISEIKDDSNINMLIVFILFVLALIINSISFTAFVIYLVVIVFFRFILWLLDIIGKSC